MTYLNLPLVALVEGRGSIIRLTVRYIWVWISWIHKVCTCLRLFTAHVYVQTFEFLRFIVYIRRILSLFTFLFLLSFTSHLDETLYKVYICSFCILEHHLIPNFPKITNSSREENFLTAISDACALYLCWRYLTLWIYITNKNALHCCVINSLPIECNQC